MAPSNSSAFLLLLLPLLLIASAAAVGLNSATNAQEVASALDALRDHDYTLFANAITTSDLQYQLLTAAAASVGRGPVSSFTLFAPKDDQLFALDMATDADVYVNTLRYHFVPNRRQAFADLQNLSSPFLATLLPHHSLLIGKALDDGDADARGVGVGVTVDGVRISTPDLYIGSRIAVHGIDGILLSGLNMHQDFGTGTGASGAPESAPAGNMPGAAAPKMQDKIEKLKDLAKRKRGRRFRRVGRGRRYHRRPTTVRDHRLGDH